jgi:glycine oxidase
VVDHDVIVVGAGIVGLATARALSGAGRHVLVVERRRVGAEASSAAAGILSAQAECDPESPLLPLALRARERHARLAAELEEETGLRVDRSSRGLLQVAFTETESEHLGATLERQRALGLSAEQLGPGELKDVEPNLSPAALRALFYAEDRCVDNVRLTRALAASAVARGTSILSGRPVTTLLREAGRLAGVVTGAERYRAPVVVNAAGAWAGLLGGDPLPPPVEPVRGQIVAFELAPALLGHVVYSERGYLVPRSDGRVLAGSTSERVGYDKSVTAFGLHAVLQSALEIAPALRDVPVTGSWAGLRPGSPDGLPIVGPGALPGLFHAAGLYRNGILLGPLVGEIVAGLVLGEPLSPELAAFSVQRFRHPA